MPGQPYGEAAIRQIKSEKDPFCGRIQTNALDMQNRHFQVWDQRITGTREDGSKGTVIGDVYWTSTGAGMHIWSGAIAAQAIAHESMHGMYLEAQRLDSSGRWHIFSDNSFPRLFGCGRPA